MCTASKDPCILRPQWVKVGEKKGCLTRGSLGGGGGGASERPGGSASRVGRPDRRAVVRPAGRVGSGGPAGRRRPKCRPAVRPAESAGRHRRRAEPPEANRPSRTAAEGTAGSFRPTQGWGDSFLLGVALPDLTIFIFPSSQQVNKTLRELSTKAEWEFTELSKTVQLTAIIRNPPDIGSSHPEACANRLNLCKLPMCLRMLVNSSIPCVVHCGQKRTFAQGPAQRLPF